MKLIIDDRITLPTEQIDVNMLNEFNIMTIELGDDTIILPQKICLNEVSMNSFFSECLSFGRGISVHYADIGGPGSEMALTLRQKPEPKTGGI